MKKTLVLVDRGTSEADGESDLRCGLWGIWEMEVMRLQRVIQIAEK